MSKKVLPTGRGAVGMSGGRQIVGQVRRHLLLADDMRLIENMYTYVGNVPAPPASRVPRRLSVAKKMTSRGTS